MNGRNGPLIPPEGVEKVRNKLLPLYRTYGREQDCQIEFFVCAHEELPEMRKQILQWTDQYLVTSSG